MLSLAALVLMITLALAGCTSDHRVSPWGAAESPKVRDLAAPADLMRELAKLDAEARALGLARSDEIALRLPRGGGPAAVRGYEGKDMLGRPTHAVRVATPRGVVMALGPLDVHDVARTEATELVPALLVEEAIEVGAGGPDESRAGGSLSIPCGADLNGDGSPDVVVRSDDGGLEIWQILPLGASRYEVAMALARPTRAVDIDRDGRIDWMGEAARDPGDPIAPHLIDVATFDAEGARYADTTPPARAFHARRAAAPIPTGSEEGAARASLERAFHAALAGLGEEAVKKELERAPSDPALRAAFERHARRIGRLVGSR